MKRWLILYGTPLSGYAILIFLLILWAGFQGLSVEDPGFAVVVGIFLLSLPVFILVVAFVWLIYRIGEFRHFVAHTRLGDATFRSSLKAEALFKRVGLFVAVCLRILIAGFPILMAIDVFVSVGGAPPILPLIILVLGFVFVIIPLFGVLWTVIVTAGAVRHICETLEIAGAESLDRIVQSAATAPKFGEGLADSFELGTG